MPVTDRRADLGRRQGALLASRLGQEIRDARRAAGLSQQLVADAAAVSQSLVSRIERATAPGAPLIHLATIGAVLGLRLAATVYPDGDPLRDAGHARLLARFRAILPSGARLPTEVPLGIPGDRRAWDAELRLGGERCPVEAETALRDLQATDRRIALKMAEGGAGRVLLLVSDTAANRRVLRAHRGCSAGASRPTAARSSRRFARVAAPTAAGSFTCDAGKALGRSARHAPCLPSGDARASPIEPHRIRQVAHWTGWHTHA